MDKLRLPQRTRTGGRPATGVTRRAARRAGTAAGWRQRGAALLLAMVILALVATVTAGMVWQQDRAVRVEAAERARAQSVWILNGALDWARLILAEDLRNNRSRQHPYDALDEVWATPLKEARLSTFLAADQNNTADGGVEAFMAGAIEDAQARYNVRNLVNETGGVIASEVQALQRLCQLAGAPADTAQRLARGLALALFPGGQEAQRIPLGPEGIPLRPGRFEDLVWLGVEETTLKLLERWVDYLPTVTPVNVNTAPREALVAAIDGLDIGSAERLVLARQREPFQKLEDVKAQLAPSIEMAPTRVSVQTTYFYVSGRLRLEDRVLEERSLLQRRDGRVEVVRRERRAFASASP